MALKLNEQQEAEKKKSYKIIDDINLLQQSLHKQVTQKIAEEKKVFARKYKEETGQRSSIVIPRVQEPVLIAESVPNIPEPVPVVTQPTLPQPHP